MHKTVANIFYLSSKQFFISEFFLILLLRPTDLTAGAGSAQQFTHSLLLLISRLNTRCIQRWHRNMAWSNRHKRFICFRITLERFVLVACQSIRSINFYLFFISGVKQSMSPGSVTGMSPSYSEPSPDYSMLVNQNRPRPSSNSPPLNNTQNITQHIGSK